MFDKEALPCNLRFHLLCSRAKAIAGRSERFRCQTLLVVVALRSTGAPRMTLDSALEVATASAASTDATPLEVLEVLTREAAGRSGHIPSRLIAAHAIRVTSGGDFPVQKAALDAILRRLSSARAQDGFFIRSRPRDASLLGLYRLKGRRSSREYRVLFRFRDPPKGSCECADFARSAL